MVFNLIDTGGVENFKYQRRSILILREYPIRRPCLNRMQHGAAVQQCSSASSASSCNADASISTASKYMADVRIAKHQSKGKDAQPHLCKHVRSCLGDVLGVFILCIGIIKNNKIYLYKYVYMYVSMYGSACTSCANALRAHMLQMYLVDWLGTG